MAEGFDHDVTGVVADTLAAMKADLEDQIASVVGGGDPEVITDLQADVAAIELTLGTLSTTVAGKADSSALTSGLAAKASTSEVSAALGTKVDQTAYDAQIALLATASALSSGLAGKVSQSTYDTFVGSMTTALSGKATAADLSSLTTTVNGHTTQLSGIVTDLAGKLQAVGALVGVNPTQLFYKVTRNGDGTATAGWANIIEIWWDPTGAPAARLVAWFNEYGELRLIPGNFNTVPLRVYAKDLIADTDHEGMLIEVVDHREGTRTTLGGFDSLGAVHGPNIFLQAVGNVEPDAAGEGWLNNWLWYNTTGEA